jgi:nitroreductase
VTSIRELIQARRSTRAYVGQPLRDEHVAAITEYIASTRAPWGVQARIEVLHAELGDLPRKLGTYGAIKGAHDFMGLVWRDGPLVAQGAGYWFEQVILFCTGLGVATCWLAGFTPSSFLDSIRLGAGEKVRYASPLGYRGGSKSLAERVGVINSDRLHLTKQPFGTLFRQVDGLTGLTEEQAGDLAEPLRMTRLAPSARNAQPYRVLVADGRADFYIQPTRFAPTDIGIALAHFDLTCQELGLPGGLSVQDDHPRLAGHDYVMSWTSLPA